MVTVIFLNTKNASAKMASTSNDVEFIMQKKKTQL